MKQLCTLVIGFILLAALTAEAGMARRYVLLEEFTQASCPPCAAFNPGFEETILKPNPSKVHHISFHTSWPGVDPMYNFNSSEINTRTSYYGISGVPHVVMLGDASQVTTFAGNQSMIDNLVEQGSPIEILVKEEEMGISRKVTVKVTNVGGLASGNYKIRTAVVEREITYATPPGSNGEKAFPNVFRKMLPGINGETFTVPAPGQSVEYSYTYNLDNQWNSAEVYTVAFVQNETTKEVINSGSSVDLKARISAAQIVKNALAGDCSFTLSAVNTADMPQNLHIKLTSEKPDGWTATLKVNEQSYGEEATISAPAGEAITVHVAVQPSSAAGIGAYTVEMSSLTDPRAYSILWTGYAISGVTDLVISNENKWNDLYLNGLATAQGSKCAAIPSGVFTKAIHDAAAAGIHSIYYNVAWTFPTLTDDGVAALKQFIDAGGNLFIAGQDIGWDQSGDSKAYGTLATKQFYANYMQAAFVADGSASSTMLSVLPSDHVFGTTPVSPLVDAYAGNLYPDVLAPLGNAEPIFYYNDDVTNVAGLRARKGNAKIVYLGIGLESISNQDTKNAIMKTTHDWFEGLITGVDMDNRFQDLFGHQYPSPASDVVNIPLTGVTKELTLRLTDAGGKILDIQRIPIGSTLVQLSTNSYPSGSYFYQVLDGTTVLRTEKLQIIH